MLRLILITLIIFINACDKQPSAKPQFKSISPGMAQNLILQQIGNDNFIILDVRTKEEFDSGHLTNAVNIDYNKDKPLLKTLKKDHTYLVYCHSGRRSQLAIDYMKNNGFLSLFNISGGIQSWKNTFDSLHPSPLNEH